MPCYNYSSSEPIYYSPNAGQWAVEKVYSVGSTYSFAAIARMCEIPAEDQLCVYTRASAGAAETKLTLDIDYTVNVQSETINLINAPASGQVVVRRCTPNDKMLFEFVDGAKITAGQLNGSLYQLLFLGQEKEWVGSVNNHYYPVAANVVAWNSGTAYVVGNYITLNNVVYQCKLGHTNQTPPNATYWTPVNFITNGFVIQGGENLGGPIRFNLSGINTGYGLVWNGTQFEAGTIGGFIDNLQDVTITSVADKHILVYDSIVSQWKNYLPTVDIRENNLKFKDFTFYNRQGTNTDQSYANGATPISAPSALDIFKNGSNEYVLTHAPTVYHILKKTIPGDQDPITFFNNVNTNINNFAASLANPVKVQLYWNLNRAVPSTDTLSDIGGDKLVNYKIAFWDSPEELYAFNMWTSVENLKYHGITTSGQVNYRDNAYFYFDGNTALRYSKIAGKGIKEKGFYLNVPECYNTALCNIPVTTSDSLFFKMSDLVKANITSPTSTSYRDEYLTALRDFAFAGVRSGIADSNQIQSRRQYDHQARYVKSFLLDADYNGWSEINYKRLESNESPVACLFKMPKQMIYYNKQALVMTNNPDAITTNASNTWPNTAFNSSAADNSTYSKTVRFTGAGDLNYTSNASSSLTGGGMGNLYKSDVFWGNWCQNWASDAGVFRFNEADIDWYLSGITATNTIPDLKLYNLVTGNVPINSGTTPVTTNDKDVNARSMMPWPYRPNYWEKTNNAYDGYIGTHLFNMDSNSIFSNAIHFVPDPRDEYVFRVVVKNSLFTYFNKDSSFNIASAIILEHGFDEHPNNAQKATINTTLPQIYRKNATPRQVQRVRTRLDKNDVKVFVQSEHVEVMDGVNQYVINLCISVPRIKSIGYAKVFRKPTLIDESGNVYFDGAGSGTTDTEIDLGTWTFYLENDAQNQYPDNANGFGIAIPVSPGGLNPTYQVASKLTAVAGRNECAVKFTRLGIPSNLWIRLSVLNTDGTTELISSGGGWNTNA